MKPFTFPRWANKSVQLAGVVLGVAPVYLTFLIWYGFSPKTIDVGYMPQQPVPYSHALHAGELGIDCRYCHNTVENAAMAAIPPVQTCMNCHARVKTKSEKLEPIRDAFQNGTALQWKKVHDLPDYVYFNHSAHVTRGVGCVTCHGRIDQMAEVYQFAPLSMGWCIDCHREPWKNLRPPSEVTNMTWTHPAGADPVAYGKELAEKNNLHPSTDCSTCHR